MKKTLRQLLLPTVLLFITACSGDPGTGAVVVEWEQDDCKRCNMILSDRFHAAQVRHKPTDGPSEIYLFDDIGCAVVWLEDQAWKDDPAIEIWVNDHATGSWLDARKAYYVTGHQTPMHYSLGAQLEAVPESMDFERAREYLFKVDRYLHQHGAQ
ncbi:MAG: nitrous oxide reductase accessory protein NosL [Candidatus Polarisedimenticolaceae bacterium]|nr:nitrous oxide reductase accessory protein NosL [Candidatus Polarisedimenticolaceae bacterium]